MLLYNLSIPIIDSNTLLVLPFLGHPMLPIQDFDAVGMLVPGYTDVMLQQIFSHEYVTFCSSYAHYCRLKYYQPNQTGEIRTWTSKSNCA